MYRMLEYRTKRYLKYPKYSYTTFSIAAIFSEPGFTIWQAIPFKRKFFYSFTYLPLQSPAIEWANTAIRHLCDLNPNSLRREAQCYALCLVTHTSLVSQPLDVWCFGPLKNVYHSEKRLSTRLREKISRQRSSLQWSLNHPSLAHLMFYSPTTTKQCTDMKPLYRIRHRRNLWQ